MFVGKMPSCGIIFHCCVEERTQEREDEFLVGGGNEVGREWGGSTKKLISRGINWA
jgi:hypothetical protein